MIPDNLKRNKEVKTEFLKFRVTRQQKTFYRIMADGPISKWALPILDRKAGLK